MGVENPYGTEIAAADVVDTLGFFDNWEDRYRYIIDLGKQLPAMPESHKRDELLVRGCQSQVWLDWRASEGRWCSRSTAMRISCAA